MEWCELQFEGEMKETIAIAQFLNADYGHYIWPSSIVMAEFIWFNKEKWKNKKIIELGAGTGLPGLLMGKLCGHMTLTEKPENVEILKMYPEAVQRNQIDQKKVEILPLKWGILRWEDHSAWESIKDYDYIIAADCFYEPSDFEDILVTVSGIFQQSKRCRFYTVYQERSSRHSIQHLLKKWKLECKKIPLASFGFDQQVAQRHQRVVKNMVEKMDSLFLVEIFPWSNEREGKIEI